MGAVLWRWNRRGWWLSTSFRTGRRDGVLGRGQGLCSISVCLLTFGRLIEGIGRRVEGREMEGKTNDTKCNDGSCDD